ncbi:hypothetical protein ACWGS9_11310 [Bradyrhizobium sp. Arg314]
MGPQTDCLLSGYLVENPIFIATAIAEAGDREKMIRRARGQQQSAIDQEAEIIG